MDYLNLTLYLFRKFSSAFSSEFYFLYESVNKEDCYFTIFYLSVIALVILIGFRSLNEVLVIPSFYYSEFYVLIVKGILSFTL